MTLARFLIFAFAFIVAGVAAYGQPSTRLRLTQIQDAPDTTNAYFIVAGQGDTILYKADIVSIDSSGRVFTVVIGTDTIRWEDTGGDSENVYTTNGSISQDRTINLENNASNDFMILQDSAQSAASTFAIQLTDPGWSHFIRTRWNSLGLWHFSKDYELYMLDGVALDIERKTGATGAFTITDNGTTATGIQYAADYSANYTNRSLVDKGYVDNRPWAWLSVLSKSLTVRNTFTTVTGFTDQEAGSDFTVTDSTITYNGGDNEWMLVSYNMATYATEANAGTWNIQYAIFLNDVQIGISTTYAGFWSGSSGGTTYQSPASTFLYTLTSGDVLKIKYFITHGLDTVTLQAANFTITKIDR